jgi:hypothetical protein
VVIELFFLTHDDERAPAAAASGERRKSAGALRWIDPWTRSTDLDVLVCIATDRTSLLCHNCSGVQPLLKSPSMSQVQEGYRPGTVCDTRMLCATQQSCHHPAAVRRTFASLFGATSARMEDLDGRAARWWWGEWGGATLRQQQIVRTLPGSVLSPADDKHCDEWRRSNALHRCPHRSCSDRCTAAWWRVPS